MQNILSLGLIRGLITQITSTAFLMVHLSSLAILWYTQTPTDYIRSSHTGHWPGG